MSDHASVHELAAAELYRPTDPATLGFTTTADLPDLDDIVGQERAVEAVTFAIGMRAEGYNVFALGPTGMGKATTVKTYVGRLAATEPAPDDWCYVHDFDAPQRPHALRLPAGRGAGLRDEMARFAADVRTALPAAFEDEAFRNQREALDEELKVRREQVLEALDADARKDGVAIVRTPVGVGCAPLHDGQPLAPEQFHKLPDAEQARIRASMEAYEARLEDTARSFPRWEREQRDKVRELERTTARWAIGHLLEDARKLMADLPDALAHLDRVESDVVENAAAIVGGAAAQDGELPPAVRTLAAEIGSTRRYEVNLLVDHTTSAGAPVIIEDDPTYQNIVGRVEYTSTLGALTTDFRLIRAGALHRANGGYLILEALKLLQQPLSWEALKRALRAREVRIGSVGQALGLMSTVTLEPEPIPLDVKVALVGDRRLYGLLAAADPDFLELFKVAADFEEDVARTDETSGIYARLIATLARRERLRPLDAGAVARIIEEGARLAADQERISTHMRTFSDLIHETDHVAAVSGHEVATASDVEAAINGRRRRSGRARDRMMDAIERGLILVDTTGEAVGQVNGLSVVLAGDQSFGMPSRITSRVRLGDGDVVDIEREVELGGPIHSKGVLILSGFLGGRYAADRPLTLHASLVFEQSYGGVEGDSASLAELIAILSALAEVPVRQSLAVTGSVDQRGDVQPVGGVNEKVEGFFDACRVRGLTGDQGVVIPRSNARDLMLRRDVVEAAAAGSFHLYPVAAVDEAVAVLTGRVAGERRADGSWTERSVNAAVEARLAALAETAREFASGGRPTDDSAAAPLGRGRRRPGRGASKGGDPG
jgi:lon-related putative ATP-dependent protease